MSIVIRKATEDDFEFIYDLINEFALFIKTPEKVTITLDQMIQDNEFFKCLVATENNTIIGFATYYFSYYSWTGKGIYIDDLYVKEKHRGQNAGTMLMDEIICIAKQENCKKVKWQVSKWNDKAIAFYAKRGAIIDGTEINCDLKL